MTLTPQQIDLIRARVRHAEFQDYQPETQDALIKFLHANGCPEPNSMGRAIAAAIEKVLEEEKES